MNIINIHELYTDLCNIYPNRTVIIGMEINGHVLYGVRRKPNIEINVWIGDLVDEQGRQIKKSELKRFETEDEFFAFVDSLRLMSTGRN